MTSPSRSRARQPPRIGGPVALKAIAPTLRAQDRRGAVELWVSHGASAVEAAAERMADRAEAAPATSCDGFLVQQMAPSGVEMLVGVVHDPRLRAASWPAARAACTAELLEDVAVRITPLTDRDARRDDPLAADVPAARRLSAARRSADVGALEDVLLRIGALVGDPPGDRGDGLQPRDRAAAGAVIVDARVRVEEVAPPRPEPALRAT